MSLNSIDYQVTIVDSPIELKDGRKFSKTAIIEKWKGSHKISSRKLGAPDKHNIYQAIEKGKSINLNDCYIKDFSLHDYRRERDMHETETIALCNFQADHAFFESEYGTDISHAYFTEGPGVFSYAVFNLGRVSFGHSKCTSSLNFNRAEFYLEELNFRFAEFDEGDLRFSSCVFDCENVLFVNTNFGKGNVSFRQADFKKSNCNFQYARFENGDVSFDKAIFRGEKIDFRKIEFGQGKAEFRRVDFGDGNISFNESEFKEGKISFRHAIFGSGEKTFENISFGPSQVSFDGSIFGSGMLSFKGTEFEFLSIRDGRLGGYCDFRVSHGKVLDISYSIVKDIIDFQAGEYSVDIESLKIEGLKMMGKLFISWEENNAYKLISEQHHTSYRSKAQQFNLLKESFHQNGKYDWEDKAYVAFKRFEMKAQLKKGNQKGGLAAVKGNFLYGSQWLIFDKAGLFATAPLRVFTSMIVVLTFFSILYILLPHIAHAEIVSSVGDPDHLSIVEKSFYHSAITFFTIGYGDYYPSGHIRWLSAVEGWAGVFLMSYFTVAFVRKILR
ncbi:MAG: potassium channel family protein [Vicingaceae bacterium]